MPSGIALRAQPGCKERGAASAGVALRSTVRNTRLGIKPSCCWHQLSRTDGRGFAPLARSPRGEAPSHRAAAMGALLHQPVALKDGSLRLRVIARRQSLAGSPLTPSQGSPKPASYSRFYSSGGAEGVRAKPQRKSCINGAARISSQGRGETSHATKKNQNHAMGGPVTAPSPGL